MASASPVVARRGGGDTAPQEPSFSQAASLHLSTTPTSPLPPPSGSPMSPAAVRVAAHDAAAADAVDDDDEDDDVVLHPLHSTRPVKGGDVRPVGGMHIASVTDAAGSARTFDPDGDSQVLLDEAMKAVEAGPVTTTKLADVVAARDKEHREQVLQLKAQLEACIKDLEAAEEQRSRAVKNADEQRQQRTDAKARVDALEREREEAWAAEPELVLAWKKAQAAVGPAAADADKTATAAAEAHACKAARGHDVTKADAAAAESKEALAAQEAELQDTRKALKDAEALVARLRVDELCLAAAVGHAAVAARRKDADLARARAAHDAATENAAHGLQGVFSAELNHVYRLKAVADAECRSKEAFAAASRVFAERQQAQAALQQLTADGAEAKLQADVTAATRAATERADRVKGAQDALEAYQTTVVLAEAEQANALRQLADTKVKAEKIVASIAVLHAFKNTTTKTREGA